MYNRFINWSHNRLNKKSVRFIAAGLTTALVATSIVIPTVAASGVSEISNASISALVEDYITESAAADPVAELVGTTNVSVQTATAPKSAAAKVYDSANAEKTVGKNETTALANANPQEAGSNNTTEDNAGGDYVADSNQATAKYPQFKDRVIVTVDSGVLNIRESASPDAEIVGTIARAGIALVEEKGSSWTKIGSGNCEGYVSNDYIAFGDDAGSWAESNGIPKYIKVQNNGLRVRKEASLDGEVLDAVYENETYSVLGQTDGWVKIEMYDGTVGYVSEEYVEVRFETPRAKTVEEIEEMRRAEEEDARREKARKEAAEKAKQDSDKESSNKESSNKESSKKESSNSGSSSKSESSSSSSSEGSSSAAERSAERIERTEEIKKENESSMEEEEYVPSTTHAELRAEMVAYAKQFLGNPYVYGGTSLTNGTDCSGFTMRIYEHFGYSIPRAGGQRTFGKLITVAEAQPGDLVFYEGHVTMYIGDGKVIHASSERTGIIISSLSYSGTPLFARNIIDAY